MNATLLLITASLLLSLSPTLTAAQSTNGCGTGWNRYLVPDEIKPLGCNFRSACDSHDVCYGQCSKIEGVTDTQAPQCKYLDCEPGGRLAGTATCDSLRYTQLRQIAQGRRTKCDAQFMIDLDKANTDKPRCLLFTAFYPFMVRVLGGSAFLGADATSALVTEEERKSYLDAFNAMTTTWSGPKIADYAKRLRDGSITVDFTRRIAFDPDVGFMNP